MNARELLSITNALADESRVRVLLALRGREVCVCQLTELLGLAPSTVSKHISILKQAGLVQSRKEGRWIHCRQAGREATAAAREAIRWVGKALEEDEQAKRDERRLAAVLKQNREALCRRQCRR